MEPSMNWANPPLARLEVERHKRDEYITHNSRQTKHGRSGALSFFSGIHTMASSAMCNNVCETLGFDGPIFEPMRSALEFFADMAHLAMPSLYLTHLGDECPIFNGKLNATQQQLNPETASAEPGDTYAMEAPLPDTLICNRRSNYCTLLSMGVLRRWPTLLRCWQNKGSILQIKCSLSQQKSGVSREIVEETLRLAGADNVDSKTQQLSLSSNDASNPNSAEALPPYIGVTDLAETSSKWLADFLEYAESDTTTKTHFNSGSSDTSAADDGTILEPTLLSSEKLLTVNKYLLRRIRKLELTNQIIREAYSEVEEMLETERQSNATQLQALKNKHEEDLQEVVKEYKERARQHMDSDGDYSDVESDADYGFRPGFTATTSKGAATAINRDYSIGSTTSCTSSPLMGPAAGWGSPPPKIQRSVSETAFTSISKSGGLAVPGDLTIEFADPTFDSELEAGSDNGSNVMFTSCSKWDIEDSDSSSCDDDDGNVDEELDASDSEDEDAQNNINGLEFAFDRICSAHGPDMIASSDSGTESDFESESESESDFDMEFSAVSEASDGDPSKNTSRSHFSSDEYALVDPARAMIDRYYPKSGKLSIAADIDCVVPESLERPKDNSATALSGDFMGRAEKSLDEQEAEYNAQLPADQRIAKFILRASSHLQQGARGGLSLGFMLHNLEIQADKYAPNHASVLCAFVESLYQLAESGKGFGDDNSQHQQPDAKGQLRSALSKKQRDRVCSPQQAVLRISKLLHTYIRLPNDQLLILQQLEDLSEANRETRLVMHPILLRTLYECELIDRGAIIKWYTSLPKGVISDNAADQADIPVDGASVTAPENDEQVASVSSLRTRRGTLLRERASPLIIELATEAGSRGSGVRSAAENAAAMEELHQQIQASECASSSNGTSGGLVVNSTSSSMHSLSSALAASRDNCCCTGTLTPMSDENASSHIQFSGPETGPVGKANGQGLLAASTSYVSVLCRTSSTLYDGHTGIPRKLSSESVSRALSASAVGGDGYGASGHHSASETENNLRPVKQVTFAA
ncbi:hypothetical protein COEREDRAFT_80767 [Coemansia reversa NRRL 1564]|uniref:W2 domain-containing protein n=1 Tax=Coemansia reversa (strain ATCC 12441 / NRRL 1564) TaxID=763665 RepID=A0A2G5BDG9_COERN|nr:hypothetical protein COEREDRAFT_80767 [Coemansia reversa NRRL 1564]|eukprot:PIA17055.1 hypothetical protein COEREDRAFT_80767 [Coemansia reversa NRRL 1564]